MIHSDVVIVGAAVCFLSLSALVLRYLITVASMSRLLSETLASLHAARTNKNTSKQLIRYVAYSLQFKLTQNHIHFDAISWQLHNFLAL